VGAIALAFASFSSLFSLPAARAAEAPSILDNGDFEADKNADGWPDGWPRQAGLSWETEGGNRFLRLKQTAPGETVMAYRPVPLHPEHKSLDMRLKLRHTGVEVGAEPWYDARFIFHFKDAAQKLLAPDPPAVAFKGSSNGWVERTIRFSVPNGAAILEVMPSLFQAKAGTFDIDDLRVVPIAADQDTPNTPAAATPVEAEPPARPPLELKVVGNQVRAADGKAVWLQGVNVPSLEWMPEGERVLQSVKVAVDGWKSNVVRLPVNDEYWFGRGPRQNGDSTKYRALVDDCVQAISRRGAYVVLDLHKYRAPRPQHIDFWKEAAGKYKNNPAVLFDIINEPHDINWAVWENGGTVEEKAAQNGAPAMTFESPGMQKMVDAVRATGARNIIVAGGLDWAYDLSGILEGHALNDLGGNGIIYSSHVYPWKSDWQKKVLAIAEKHPVLLGEVGCDSRKMDFLPLDKQENPYTWAPDMMGAIQKHKLHWTAWSFHTDATPRVLADWEYNPTPFWGAWVKAALLGARFEMNRPR
jgi:hypothetical protein